MGLGLGLAEPNLRARPRGLRRGDRRPLELWLGLGLVGAWVRVRIRVRLTRTLTLALTQALALALSRACEQLVEAGARRGRCVGGAAPPRINTPPRAPQLRRWRLAQPEAG